MFPSQSSKISFCKHSVFVEDDSFSNIETDMIAKPPFYLCRILRPGYKPILGVMNLLNYKHTNSKIMLHEQINEAKIKKYMDQLLAEGLLNNPILLFHKKFPEFQQYLSSALNSLTVINTQYVDDICYEILPIKNFAMTVIVQNFLNKISKFYVADGHHRIRALSRIYSQDVPRFFISLIAQEGDLKLGSFNRFIKNTNINFNALANKLKNKYSIKKVNHQSLNLDSHIHFYNNKDWYQLNLKKNQYHDKFIRVPAVNIDKIIMPSLGLNPTSCVINKILYAPNTYHADDSVHFYHQNHCQLGIHVPRLSLSDLYKVTEERYVLPPHSTYFTPKIPNNLIIQKLRFSNDYK